MLLSDKPFTGEGRLPFQGNMEQVVSDLVEHSQIAGIDEVLLDLCITTRDVHHLLDVSRELYTTAREAGV
ncbi:hypothetical protein AB5J55_00085 [Streptomyces sp. R11]|uniref:Uncharacterized protein n=1 Tax=Streptomyces sp. R11 TaxID=3238625 RepID=A0AB39MSP8_9ACTN